MTRDEEVKQAFAAYREGRIDNDGRPKPFDQQLALWEAMWQAADFSWEGLADAGWERGEDANEAQKLKRWRAPEDFPGGGDIQGEDGKRFKRSTLQDYWRWTSLRGWTNNYSIGAGTLISPAELEELGLLTHHNNRLWHAVHLPIMPCKTLIQEILARFELSHLMGNLNVNLTGARALDLDVIWRLHAEPTRARRPLFISAPLSNFQRLDASDLVFGENADFELSIFVNRSNFCLATFAQATSFAYVAFGARHDFYATKFGDRISFECATFTDHANFYGAEFRGDSWFGSSSFSNKACFSKVSFHGATSFRNVYSADLVSFDHAKIADDSDFRWANTVGGATFSHAYIGRRVSFNGASSRSLVDFTYTTFEDNATLEEAEFASMDLCHSVFKGSLDASHLSCVGRFRMRAAQVGGYADFSDAAWPESLEDQQAAFEGCRFRDVANFKTKDFYAFALFDGAVFANSVLLTEPVTGQTMPDQLFDRALQAAKEAAERDQTAAYDFARKHHEWTANENRTSDDEPKDLTADERGEDARYGALAGGLRTLRRAMAAQGDIDREHRFYRYELKARAQRPSEPGAAKLAANIYRRLSDYGSSIGRPVVSLALSILIFALIYSCLGWKLGIEVQGSHFGQAFSLSLNNTFRPFSALSAKEFDEGTLGRFLLTHGDGIRNLVQAIAILQSLMALMCLFLFGLALRRRFRIS